MKTSSKFQAPKTFGEGLLLLFSIIFFIAFLYLFLHSILANGAPYIAFSTGKVILMAVVLLAVILLLIFINNFIEHKIKKGEAPSADTSTKSEKNKTVSKRTNQANFRKLELQRRKRLLYWAIGFVVLFIVQILYARTFYAGIGWDCGTLFTMAVNLLNHDPSTLGYLAQFPNNTAIFMLLYYYLKLCLALGVKDLIFAAVVLNIIFIDSAIILLIAAANRIWSSRIARVLAIFLAVISVAFFPWLIVPYTDTLSMCYPIAFLYLCLAIEDGSKAYNRKKQILLLLVLGVLMYLGYKLKPSTMILMIALGIAFLCRTKLTKQKLIEYGKNIILTLCGVLVAFTLFTLTSGSLLDQYITKEAHESYEMPISYFTLVGLKKTPVNEEKALWGAFNSDDYFTVSNIQGKAEKNAYAVTESKNRIKAFGSAGYIEYLLGKANFCFEDGTFFWGGEGGFIAGELPVVKNPLTRWIQNYVYNSSKNYGATYSNFLQAIWITLLFFMLAGMVIAPNSYKNTWMIVSRIAVFGLLMYLLILEARSRYIIHYLPVFILLAVDGVIAIQNFWVTFRQKKN